MHVDDFATLKVLVEKCNNHILSFCDKREELGFNDFRVCAVAKSFIVLFLFVICLHHF